MARFHVSMKVKHLSCNFDSNLDNSLLVVAQSVLTLKGIYDWFDWSCIDDVIITDGDPSVSSGFSVYSSISHYEGEND